jgi:predicted adenylyl cyclase CyaB
LIAYERPDEAGPAVSDYSVLRTENPAGLRGFLSEILGVRGVVRKRRLVYRIGRTRVHLDDVDGLGTFLEVEVVLDDAQSEEDGATVASEILATLGVPEESRVASAYIDLLDRSRT